MATLGQAVLAGNKVVEGRQAEALAAVPAAYDSTGRTLVTFSDAQAVVQEGWDRRHGKAASGKSKAKAAPTPPPAPEFPGARIGGSREQSAFRLLMEVRWPGRVATGTCLVA